MAADVITIDGPTSSGKNSVGLLFSQKIGYRFLDTGSIYRAYSLYLLNNGVDIEDEDSIVEALGNAKVEYVDEDLEQIVLLDGENVSHLLHTPPVTAIVADIAHIGRVREIAREFQRLIGKRQDTVMAGRDIGTVIFPDARVKYYLTADPEVRAKRRYAQLVKQHPDISLIQVLKQLNERDQKDMTREISPLKVPEGAFIIDTTKLTVEESVKKMIRFYIKKTKLKEEFSSPSF